MTEKEAKKLHHELWDWLSHNPSKMKRDWPGWKAVVHANYTVLVVHSNCFACFVAKQRQESQGTAGMCENCPLKAIACYDGRNTTYYDKWCYYKSKNSKTTRSKYARLIRDSWTREVTPL